MKTNKNQADLAKVAKKSTKKESIEVIAKTTVARKYNLNYAELSAKDQKKERTRRRAAIKRFIALHFELKTKKDAEGLKALKAEFREFVKANYTADLKTAKPENLYKMKTDKEVTDLANLITFANQ